MIYQMIGLSEGSLNYREVLIFPKEFVITLTSPCSEHPGKSTLYREKCGLQEYTLCSLF